MKSLKISEKFPVKKKCSREFTQKAKKMQTKLLNDSQICILATERNKLQPVKKLKKMGVRVLKNRPKSSREKQILSVKIAGKRLKIVFGYFFFSRKKQMLLYSYN